MRTEIYYLLRRRTNPSSHELPSNIASRGRKKTKINPLNIGKVFYSQMRVLLSFMTRQNITYVKSGEKRYTHLIIMLLSSMILNLMYGDVFLLMVLEKLCELQVIWTHNNM